ncbi:MAG: hypothetical protein KUG81_03130 [Gammaproteobacteria bacterium]|nr:hypothetical protein [Gammaproteobacteria bacterium]
MDNAEILTKMGFEHITGHLWKRNDMGIINIPITASLNKITCEIFRLGQASKQDEIKKALNL